MSRIVWKSRGRFCAVVKLPKPSTMTNHELALLKVATYL